MVISATDRAGIKLLKFSAYVIMKMIQEEGGMIYV